MINEERDKIIQLWFSVLADALDDARKLGKNLLSSPDIARKSELVIEGLEAIEWLFFSDHKCKKGGSYSFVCQYLDLDPINFRYLMARDNLIQVSGRYYQECVLGIKSKRSETKHPMHKVA